MELLLLRLFANATLCGYSYTLAAIFAKGLKGGRVGVLILPGMIHCAEDGRMF